MLESVHFDGHTGGSATSGDALKAKHETGELAGIQDAVWNLSPAGSAFILFLFALLVRVTFLFITPNNGVDAWARYLDARSWLANPAALPEATARGAWLPLHFWLLGGALWLWNSEWSARTLTMLLGALTILPFWGAMRRAFGDRVAFASSLAFAFFGFHVGYSVSTSSEVPTIFLVALSLYGWVRFYSQPRWSWALVAGLSLDAASLCRFEAWLIAPVLTAFLLDYSAGWRSFWKNHNAWWNAIRFGALANAAPAGWLLFSWWKWGDPMMLPHQTISENLSKIAPLHHSFLYRLVVVPGALTLSLSPVVACLMIVGVVIALSRGTALVKSVAALALTLFIFNFYNSIRHEATQSKYTLVYSWLFLPLAFLGLEWVSPYCGKKTERVALGAALLFFIMWQAGIASGGIVAGPAIADKLAVISPTLPPRTEIRYLVGWLQARHSLSEAVILDDYNYEGEDIFRFARVDPSKTFTARVASYDDPLLSDEIGDFVRQKRPRFLICSPDGPVGQALLLGQRTDVNLPSFGARLNRVWHGEHWEIFEFNYVP
jgi:hypothetical protein